MPPTLARHRIWFPVAFPPGLLFLLTLLVIGAGQPAAAQYSIPWHSIAGGGATSTGGVYSLSGTIGQMDAGATMSASAYSLEGGFWSWLARTETAGAPSLSIALSNDNSILLSWPASATGWVLQQKDDLNTLPWSPVAETSVLDGSNKTVIVPTSTDSRYYRLSKP